MEAVLKAEESMKDMAGGRGVDEVLTVCKIHLFVRGILQPPAVYIFNP